MCYITIPLFGIADVWDQRLPRVLALWIQSNLQDKFIYFHALSCRLKSKRLAEILLVCSKNSSGEAKPITPAADLTRLLRILRRFRHFVLTLYTQQHGISFYITRGPGLKVLIIFSSLDGVSLELFTSSNHPCGECRGTRRLPSLVYSCCPYWQYFWYNNITISQSFHLTLLFSWAR